MKVMGVIDLVLVKRGMLKYVHDMKTEGRMGLGIPDHYAVLCKLG